MKPLLCLATVLFLFTAIYSQNDTLWLRYPAISPDGQTLLFEYKGDIWSVPTAGGTAVPLTLSESYEFAPVWSHDGKSIAFASDRYGNIDVFIMPAGGGDAKRLTYHSTREVPVSFTASSFMSFPPQGLSMRWYSVYMDSPTWWSATMRSLSVATATAAVSTILGTGAALVLTRQSVPGRVAIMSLILAPLILPRIITAVALFYLFARMGLVGTQLGLILGHTALAVPSVVVT